MKDYLLELLENELSWIYIYEKQIRKNKIKSIEHLYYRELNQRRAKAELLIKILNHIDDTNRFGV